jgi:hypothetical protein
MAQQRALPQSKETLLQSYNKRLKDDIKSIMDNFTEIIKTAKVCGSCSEAIGEGWDWFSLGPGYRGEESRGNVTHLTGAGRSEEALKVMGQQINRRAK